MEVLSLKWSKKPNSVEVIRRGRDLLHYGLYDFLHYGLMQQRQRHPRSVQIGEPHVLLDDCTRKCISRGPITACGLSQHQCLLQKKKTWVLSSLGFQ